VQGDTIGCSSLTAAQRKIIPQRLFSHIGTTEAPVETLLFDMPTLYYLANIQNNTLLVNISASLLTMPLTLMVCREICICKLAAHRSGVTAVLFMPPETTTTLCT
jgi:hypothetical protein